MKDFLNTLLTVLIIAIVVVDGGYLLIYRLTHIDETNMRMFVNNWWQELIMIITLVFGQIYFLRDNWKR